MMQDVLRNSGGISLYGVISVCLFFLLFAGTLLWALRLKQSYLDSMRALPLEDENAASPTKGESRDERA